MTEEFEFDIIGYWSEIKLEIIREYAKAYLQILKSKNQNYLKPIYIDAFSGAGKHISKSTGDEILGSPQLALKLEPSFNEYHFIDMNSKKIQYLESNTDNEKNAFFYNGDCNEILLNKIFPLINYKDYKRALCLLDPYGLQLDWNVIEKAGKSKVIEIFLNFPVLDINRNVIWHKPNGVTQKNLKRMNTFWGDDSWKKIAYTEEQALFETELVKTKPDVIIKEFQERLKKIAGFKYVPDPMPMRNSLGNIVYYLFFASPNETANKIVTDIFYKHKDRKS